MTPAERIRNGIGALRDRWARECPRGTPVPLPDGCEDCSSVTLAALVAGATGRVTCLADPKSAATRQLAAFGVLPGVELELVQRSPAFVVRVGQLQLALDEESARRVRVRPPLHARFTGYLVTFQIP